MKKFRVIFKRKGYKDILAGDCYGFDAKNEKDARHQFNVLKKATWWMRDWRIAWVDEVDAEGKTINW
jgi:hypothetical protein